MEQFSSNLKEQDSKRNELTRIEETLEGLIALRVNEALSKNVVSVQGTISHRI